MLPLTLRPEVKMDGKLQERESQPPSRVWRVVPPTRFDVPAWVVGSLTHLALRYWRFPDDGAATSFTGFLRPFAIEAGLTDPTRIDTALNRVAKLLTRFQGHTLYPHLSAAERCHELPYTLILDNQPQSGIIDLLYRAGPNPAWTIAEFKTDRLAKGVDLERHIKDKGYYRQVQTYQAAVVRQLGVTPEVLFIFLNVGRSVTSFNYSEVMDLSSPR